MQRGKQPLWRRKIVFVVVFLVVNLISIAFLTVREKAAVNQKLFDQAAETEAQFGEIMETYERSFQLFAHMMAREIEHEPDPDSVRTYLKGMDASLLNIVGETYDGLYMYYKGQYLYSWDTPYSVYEDSGYVVTERPWYQDAVAGKGEIVFTPPYMSYANHYILTTISQLQADGETVFAYDIKMEDIQNLVSSMEQFQQEQILIYDGAGTVVGSTVPGYLGGNLQISLEEAAQNLEDAQAELDALKKDSGAETAGAEDTDRAEDAAGAEDTAKSEEIAKAEEKRDSAAAFLEFRQRLSEWVRASGDLSGSAKPVTMDGNRYYLYNHQTAGCGLMVLVPEVAMLKATVGTWLVPFLVMELILIYVLGSVGRELRNQELRAAYVKMGQIQKRLELALSAAQKAAAVDDLTGLMNFKSFQKEVGEQLDTMDEKDSGILIMIDGDHFKRVNDNYGHSVGDEVIRLSAQMIIGRIRTVDLASRLHGDEFAIFVSNTDNYDVARTIMEDINASIAKEAGKRNMPAITLSAGAVTARRGGRYTELFKAADEALYQAKKTHNGGFASFEEL